MLDFIQMFGILLIIVMVISFIIKILKQPIILGYVIAGMAFAMLFVSNVSLKESVVLFSGIGITFLLFLMGIEFDLKSLKYLGKDILIVTLLQSMIFFAAGFGLGFVFGFALIESIYLGILFIFSSTLLVAKWVDDKKETNELYGKMTLGILIMQDVFAIIILTVLSILKESSLLKIALVPVQGVALVLIAFILAKYLLNTPLKLSSRYPELLFLVSLGVCFIFVVLAPMLGYSTTIGAFIGGVVLANTLYKSEILARLRPLVTFFNMLFFVGLGFQMRLNLDLRVMLFIALLCLLSLVLKPIIIYITFRMRGYDLKTSFYSGIYLSQMSEFGIIILAGGVISGAIGPSMNSIAIISVIASMIFSSYLIKYGKEIFKWIEPYMKRLDKKFLTKEVKLTPTDPGCEVIFFGYYDLDRELLEKYRSKGKKIAVIDNDPENIALLKEEGIKCIYGSINNPDFFDHINFSKVEVAVSSHTDIDDNKTIIREIKKESPKAVVIATAKRLKDALALYKNEADYVIYTEFLNEKKVTNILNESITDFKKMVDEKIFDMAKLQEKEERSKKIRDGGEFRDLEHVFRAKKKAKVSAAEPKTESRKDIPDEVQEYLEKQRWLYRHGADHEMHANNINEKSLRAAGDVSSGAEKKKKDEAKGTKEPDQEKDKDKETRDEVLEFLEKRLW